MKKLILVTFAAFIAVGANAQDIFGLDTKAYMMMPAESISGGIVANHSISESGRWIVYQRQIAKSPEEVRAITSQNKGDWFAYDRKSKQSIKLKVPALTASVTVMGDDRYGLFMVSDEQESNIGFVDLTSGTSMRLQPHGGQVIYTGEFPFAPFVMVQKSETDYLLLYPNGKQGQMQLSKGYRMYFPIGSDQASTYFFVRNREVSAFPSQQLTYNNQTGATSFKNLTTEENNKIFASLRPQTNFIVRPMGDMVYISQYSEERPAPNKSLIPDTAKVGPRSGRYDVANNSEFVIYQDAGALLLREIKPVDALTAQKVLEDDLKKELLNRAKQMGTAFAIYAADNEDTLPGAEGWEAKIRPYIKNDEMMKGFNYTFRGGDMNVDNPAKTEMGFLMGPGGRAVVYMDGSARWIPNP